MKLVNLLNDVMKWPRLFTLIMVILQSCNGSDSSEELGNGYWLRIEGPGSDEILSLDSN